MRQLKVHVLVHHRWSDVVPKGQVKVALLRHDLPANGVVPISQLWPQLVGVAAPAAAQPATLQDGWTRAATDLWLNPQDDVDTRVPRTVTFDVDLSAGSSRDRDRVPGGRHERARPDQRSRPVGRAGQHCADRSTCSSSAHRTSARGPSRSTSSSGAGR